MEKPEGAQTLQHELLSDAQDATNKEHELTFLQAIKLYPKAVGWSVLMSTALVMDGYDTKLIGSLFAQPAFQQAYGKLQSDGKYQIPAPWQSGLNNGSNVGQMIGLFFSGYISERFGFRKTMIGALLMVPCLIFIQFFAPSLRVLETGQILLGKEPDAYVAKSLTASRHSSWHLPDHHMRLRHRGDADMSASIPYELCQLVLGKPPVAKVDLVLTEL